MLGANPMTSNGSLMTAPSILRRLKALTARGKLVVVDPRRTETAAVASLHIPIRPGGDVLFLLALLQAMRRIGRRGWTPMQDAWRALRPHCPRS